MRMPLRWTAVLGLVAVLAVTACADREATSQDTGQDTSSAAVSAESGAAGTPAKDPADEDKPIRIAQGQRVELNDYLAEGQITVFDFMSDYCGPCVRIAPFLDRLHREREDITVVKVDINRPDVRGIDWRSPVAQQYNMNSIPHFKIYGADGELMAEGQQASALLDRWLRELAPTGR